MIGILIYHGRSLDERFGDGIPSLDKERLCDLHKREVELAL